MVKNQGGVRSPRPLDESPMQSCRNHGSARGEVNAGLELPGGLGGWTPPSSCLYRRSFLSENRFKISIPVQKFKNFDIWPPSSFRSIPTLGKCIVWCLKNPETVNVVRACRRSLLKIHSRPSPFRVHFSTGAHSRPTGLGLHLSRCYVGLCVGLQAKWAKLRQRYSHFRFNAVYKEFLRGDTIQNNRRIGFVVHIRVYVQVQRRQSGNFPFTLCYSTRSRADNVKNSTLLVKSMKFLVQTVHTTKFIFRCGGKLALTSENVEVKSNMDMVDKHAPL